MTSLRTRALSTSLLLLLTATPSLADDYAQQQCVAQLAKAEADSDSTVELLAEDVVIASVKLETSSRSRFVTGNDYVEKETRINRGGREMVYEHTYDCEEGALVLKSSVPLDDTLPTIRWKPGLPLLTFPLTPGSTWSYDGTHVDVIYGSDSKAGATASGTIDGYETLLLPDGTSVSALHARVVMSWGKKDARETIVQDTWYTLDPLRIVKRNINDSGAGRLIELNIKPAQQESTITTTTKPKKKDDGAVIIKIKGTIE